MSSSIFYDQFELPEVAKVLEETGEFARFVIEPFERGFSHTLGNALRRILLTSLEAPAVVSFWMEGVLHEYMALEGVVEQVLYIVLNLKKSLFRNIYAKEQLKEEKSTLLRTQFEVTEEDLEREKGQKAITLGSLFSPDLFEIVNPDLVLFHVTMPMKREISLRIEMGRGYVPSERHSVSKEEFAIDSTFTPVLGVNYYVENTRVAQATDYDRLMLEITTDGRVSPREALSLAAQIAKHHFAIFETLFAVPVQFEPKEDLSAPSREGILQKLSRKVEEVELSVRCINCLEGAGIEYLGQLVVKTEAEMLECKNFGKKSLEEIREKLDELELSFGMDLSIYEIDENNIREILVNYHENGMVEE